MIFLQTLLITTLIIINSIKTIILISQCFPKMFKMQLSCPGKKISIPLSITNSRISKRKSLYIRVFFMTKSLIIRNSIWIKYKRRNKKWKNSRSRISKSRLKFSRLKNRIWRKRKFFQKKISSLALNKLLQIILKISFWKKIKIIRSKMI